MAGGNAVHSLLSSDPSTATAPAAVPAATATALRSPLAKVQFTISALFVLAILGLVALNKLGFSFTVAVGK